MDELKNGGESPIVVADFVGESRRRTKAYQSWRGSSGKGKFAYFGFGLQYGTREAVSGFGQGPNRAKSPVSLLDHLGQMLPEASITVATPYFSGRLKAKWLENSIYDLVL